VASSLLSLSLGFAISKQALVGAPMTAHAAKGFHRRKIHLYHPDGAISFHDP